MANEASRSKRFEEATAHYERVIDYSARRLVPPSVLVDARTGLAAAYFMLHRYQKSLDTLKPLIASAGITTMNQLPSQAWVIRGLDCLEVNRLEDAIYSFRQGLAKDANSANARLALGDALARSSRLEESAKEFEEQTRRTPALADAWYKLGLAHSELADRLLADSEKKSSGNLVAMQLLAEELLSKGSNLEAAKRLFHILREAPNRVGIHADLGHALLQLGYLESAENHLRKELAVDPMSPLAMVDLAQIAALRDNWNEVSAQLTKAARLHPRAVRLLLELPPAGLVSQAWREKKMHPPQAFLESPPGEVWSVWRDGAEVAELLVPESASASSLCKENGLSIPGAWLPQTCYEVLRARLRGHKALSTGERVKLTEAEFRLGHYRAALQAAKLTLQAKTGADWGTYWLTKSHVRLADECFAKVAVLNPESPRVHQMLATRYAAGLDYGKARAEYETAIRLAPDLPDLHLGLGTVCWRTSDWPQAEKEFQTTLELAPGSAMARCRLGNVYVQESRWNEAIEVLQPVADEPSVRLSARLDLAEAESSLGRLQDAIHELLPLTAEDMDGEVHFRLAGLYRKAGDGPRAREALETFRRLRAASLEAGSNNLRELDEEQGRSGERTAPKSP